MLSQNAFIQGVLSRIRKTGLINQTAEYRGKKAARAIKKDALLVREDLEK